MPVPKSIRGCHWRREGSGLGQVVLCVQRGTNVQLYRQLRSILVRKRQASLSNSHQGPPPSSEEESHRQEAPKGAGVQGRGGSPCTWPSSSCLLVSHSSDSAHPCSAASVAWEESSLDSVRFPFPTVKSWFPSLWSRAASLWCPW